MPNSHRLLMMMMVVMIDMYEDKDLRQLPLYFFTLLNLQCRKKHYSKTTRPNYGLA